MWMLVGPSGARGHVQCDIRVGMILSVRSATIEEVRV